MDDGGLTGWQLLTLAILNLANRGSGKGAILGDIGVRRAMEAIADQDDALLVSESALHDPYIAEAAAAIASTALPNEELELTEEMMAHLANVLTVQRGFADDA
jgi:hypothetical protein